MAGTSNYEYLDVFCSWDEPRRVADKEEQFHQLWDGRSRGAIVIPIPDDYQEYLKQVAPPTDPTKPKPPPVPPEDERDLLWSSIRDSIANDPATTAETAATELWPHQENFRIQRATGPGPDRLLIADEVGLGKTIQAGILLKTRINQGKVNRLLILTPKSALRQWQQELQHKFNISVPILERAGSQMVLIHPDGSEEPAPGPTMGHTPLPDVLSLAAPKPATVPGRRPPLRHGNRRRGPPRPVPGRERPSEAPSQPVLDPTQGSLQKDQGLDPDDCDTHADQRNRTVGTAQSAGTPGMGTRPSSAFFTMSPSS